MESVSRVTDVGEEVDDWVAEGEEKYGEAKKYAPTTTTTIIIAATTFIVCLFFSLIIKTPKRKEGVGCGIICFVYIQ